MFLSLIVRHRHLNMNLSEREAFDATVKKLLAARGEEERKFHPVAEGMCACGPSTFRFPSSRDRSCPSLLSSSPLYAVRMKSHIL
jgi:hypothetical protein